jgi:hypothetical protein
VEAQMLEQNPMTLAEAMAHWHEFYALLGTASATLVGLLFVAATVSSGVFTSNRRAPLRLFLSASVVHFSGILAICLVVLAPVQTWMHFGLLVLGCGVFGLVYCGVIWRDSVSDGLSAVIDLEDRIWYVLIPVVGYLLEAGTGATLALRLDLGCTALALAVGVLMVAGVHNAWDITIWIITRPRE